MVLFLSLMDMLSLVMMMSLMVMKMTMMMKNRIVILTLDEERMDGEIGIEMDPPCSADDVSDEEASEVFDTENVVVCQYEKISRSRNRWKVVLKDGVMSLNGRDYAFHKAC